MRVHLCIYSKGTQLLSSALEEHRCLLPGFLSPLLPIGAAGARLSLKHPNLVPYSLGGSAAAVILKAQDRPMGRQQEMVLGKEPSLIILVPLECQ